MAESYSDEDDTSWVFYKDRPDWKDVDPVPQDDGPHPVVAIAYSEKFKDVYDYFRAVLKSKEKSERALKLTKDALELNPANYTVWQYRRELLKHLSRDLEVELEYVKQVIEDYPKNYQVWHHRRVVVEWLQNPSKELHLTEIILNQDAKNYHAWQHRQWVVRTFNLFPQEMEFVERLLIDDIRNNSAWNQRYFVIMNTTGFTPEVVQREVEFTCNMIEKVTNNESAWNYLRGILLHHEGGLSQDSIVARFCENLYESGNRSPYLLAFLVDVCEEHIEKSASSGNEYVLRALKLCESLAEQHDTIRREYWKYLSRSLAQQNFKLSNIDGSGEAPPLVEEVVNTDINSEQ